MKYTGGCHCKKIRFEIETKIETLVACNCSICNKKGNLMIFVPDAQFKFTSSTETLADYQFGKKSIHHHFCSNCGIGIFGATVMPDGTKSKAINVRCLDDVDWSQYPIHQYDGASL